MSEDFNKKETETIRDKVINLRESHKERVSRYADELITEMNIENIILDEINKGNSEIEIQFPEIVIQGFSNNQQYSGEETWRDVVAEFISKLSKQEIWVEVVIQWNEQCCDRPFGRYMRGYLSNREFGRIHTKCYECGVIVSISRSNWSLMCENNDKKIPCEIISSESPCEDHEWDGNDSLSYDEFQKNWNDERFEEVCGNCDEIFTAKPFWEMELVSLLISIPKHI